jgi:hypothetical protein
LARGEAQLACQCGTAECPATAERKAVSDVVIHVLAEQATLNGSSDQPGYLPGFGILPAESVRDLATTATLTPLAIPSGAPDPGYRPTAKTAEFVRWRDLTCRWPGCDAPVERCRYRPHRALSGRCDPSLRPEALLPHPPGAEGFSPKTTAM